jgi:hypothetical protein
MTIEQIDDFDLEIACNKWKNKAFLDKSRLQAKTFPDDDINDLDVVFDELLSRFKRLKNALPKVTK